LGDVPAAGEPAPIADLEFVNETEGYLTITSDDEDNVGIWYTDDAGETWEQRHSGQDPRAFAAAGESGPFWFGTFEGDYKFWSSEDGSSFSPMREVAFEGNPRHPDAGPEFGMTETADSVHFFDADNGIFTSTSASRIQYTDDGGQTWYSVDVDTDAGGLNQMDTAGDEVWIAGANSFGNDAGEGAYVVRSEDRGQTWQQVKGFVDDAHNFEGGGAQALYIADDQGDNVWVGGEARQLYFTEDGGESWNQVKEINDRVNTIWNIDGAGDVIVAVVSTELGSGILQSEDGGDTWELVVDREDEIFHDVEVVNEELAYAYTSDDPAGTNPGHWLVWDEHSTDNLVGLE
jgi:photosystem II stability/assembly factor-like uncharacterized protein